MDTTDEFLKSQIEFANAARQKLEVDQLREMQDAQRDLTPDERSELCRIEHTLSVFDGIVLNLAGDFLRMTEKELIEAVDIAFKAATLAVRKVSALEKVRNRILNRQN